jgi:DNA-binding NarL/FixJ family response regulator
MDLKDSRAMDDWLLSTGTGYGGEGRLHERDGSSSDAPVLLRVALAGGQASLRHALRELLDAQPSLSVVGVAQEFDDLPLAAGAAAVDLVLLDVQLPDAGTILRARDFRQGSPGYGLVLYTTHADARVLTAAVFAGATGHIAKTLDGETLTAALTGLHQHAQPIPRANTGLVRWYEAGLTSGRPGFSAHEFSLLRLIAAGHPDREIAGQLHLDQLSYRREVERLYSALSSRPDLRGPGSQLARLLSR